LEFVRLLLFRPFLPGAPSPPSPYGATTGIKLSCFFWRLQQSNLKLPRPRDRARCLTHNGIFHASGRLLNSLDMYAIPFFFPFSYGFIYFRCRHSTGPSKNFSTFQANAVLKRAVMVSFLCDSRGSSPFFFLENAPPSIPPFPQRFVLFGLYLIFPQFFFKTPALPFCFRFFPPPHWLRSLPDKKESRLGLLAKTLLCQQSDDPLRFPVFSPKCANTPNNLEFSKSGHPPTTCHRVRAT